MAKWYEILPDDLAAVVRAQPVFFVATAAEEARINLSPKGMDTLRVLDDATVAYLDLTGSGNETAAHLLADGRITLMVCRFDRTADIIRIYGNGRVVTRGSDEWERLIDRWDVIPGARQVIVVDVTSVQSSCGYAVPRMEFVEERQTLRRYAEGKGEVGMAAYRAEKNTTSIDGLPAPAMDPSPA